MVVTRRPRKLAAVNASAPAADAPPKTNSKPDRKKTSATRRGKAAAVGVSTAKAPKAKSAVAKAAAKLPPVKKTAAKSASTKAAPIKKTRKTAKTAKTAKVKPTTATQINYTAFPHIFDRIVFYAPHGGLLALRAASRDLQERCDALLARHIVLGRGLRPPRGQKWAAGAPHLPLGPTVQLPGKDRVHVASAHGALPGWVCDLNHDDTWHGIGSDSCGAQCTALRARWLAYFAHTRVLDIHLWNCSAHLMHHTNLFPAATVRVFLYQKEQLWLPCEDVVVFTSFQQTGGASNYGRRGRYDWWIPDMNFLHDPHVRRAVFHARLDCARPDLPECRVELSGLDRRMRGGTGVIILEPTPGTLVAPNKAWRKDRVGRVGLLRDVADMISTNRTTSWTVVGASEIPHQICGLSHDEGRTHDEFAAAVTHNIIKWIRRRCSEWLRPEAVEERVAAIGGHQLRFLTNAEYRAQVGEARWALDTVRTVKQEKVRGWRGTIAL